MKGGANAPASCVNNGDIGDRGRAGVDARDELDDPEAGDDNIVRGAVRAGDDSFTGLESPRTGSSSFPSCATPDIGVAPRDFDLREGGRGRGFDLRDDASSSVSVGRLGLYGVTGNDIGTGKPFAFPRPLAVETRGVGVFCVMSGRDGGVLRRFITLDPPLA